MQHFPASYGLNQSAGILPDAYKNLLDHETFNLTFSIPLFQWGKATAQIESALSRKRQDKGFHRKSEKIIPSGCKVPDAKILSSAKASCSFGKSGYYCNKKI